MQQRYYQYMAYAVLKFNSSIKCSLLPLQIPLFALSSYYSFS